MIGGYPHILPDIKFDVSTVLIGIFCVSCLRFCEMLLCILNQLIHIDHLFVSGRLLGKLTPVLPLYQLVDCALHHTRGSVVCVGSMHACLSCTPSQHVSVIHPSCHAFY